MPGIADTISKLEGRLQSLRTEHEKHNDESFFRFYLFVSLIGEGADILLMGLPVSSVVNPFLEFFFYTDPRTKVWDPITKLTVAGTCWLFELIPGFNMIPTSTVQIYILSLHAKEKAKEIKAEMKKIEQQLSFAYRRAQQLQIQSQQQNADEMILSQQIIQIQAARIMAERRKAEAEADMERYTA